VALTRQSAGALIARGAAACRIIVARHITGEVNSQ
jgi:hypothetical protein